MSAAPALFGPQMNTDMDSPSRNYERMADSVWHKLRSAVFVLSAISHLPLAPSKFPGRESISVGICGA
jgi:hypothetical protein